MERRHLLVGLGGLVTAAATLGGSAVPVAVASARPTGAHRDPPGLTRVEEVVGGMRRSWHVYVPPDLEGTAPLVMAIHGHGGNGAVMYRRHGWAQTLREQGWIGVFPDAGISGAPKGDQEFLQHVLDHTVASQPVDRSRVWVVGFSGGGKKAYLLAAQRSDLVSAIAVASTRIGHREDEADWSPERHGAKKVSVLHVHGEKDTRIPLSGPDTRHDMVPVPFQEGLEIWAVHDDAAPVKDPERPEGVPGRVRVHRWASDDGYVVLGLVDPELAHRWPRDYANSAMVAFLKAAPLRR